MLRGNSKNKISSKLIKKEKTIDNFEGESAR